MEQCQEAFAMFRAKKANAAKAAKARTNKPCKTSDVVHIDAIINLSMPHVAEQVFQCLSENDLIQCLKVSKTWKAFALLQKCRGKLLEACKAGKTEIVRLLLNNGYDTKLNATHEDGMTPFAWACFG